MAQLQLQGESAQVVYRDGHTLTVDSYDELKVETRTPTRKVLSRETAPHRSSVRYAFHAPIQGSLTDDTLQVRDERFGGAFPRNSVTEIELSEVAYGRSCSSRGCVRSVSFRLDELSQFRLQGASAQVVYRNGRTRVVSYDKLTVETHTTEPPASLKTEVFYLGREHSFRTPVAGSLTEETLELSDDGSRHVFPRKAIDEIDLSEGAPERFLIVLGAAVGTALLFGLLANSGSDSCEPTGGFECDHHITETLIGVPIGFGLGLAVSIPLTSGLGSEREAPRVDIAGTSPRGSPRAAWVSR